MHIVKEIKTHFFRYLLGGLSGIALILIIIRYYPCSNCNSYLIRNEVVDDTLIYHNIEKTKEDTVQRGAIGNIPLNSNEKLEEQINSLNSRINDFYVFAGIIITLLLAINVSVYIRTDNEVEKHMKKNFESYQIQIRNTANEAKITLGRLVVYERWMSSQYQKYAVRSPEKTP